MATEHGKLLTAIVDYLDLAHHHAEETLRHNETNLAGCTDVCLMKSLELQRTQMAAERESFEAMKKAAAEC